MAASFWHHKQHMIYAALLAFSPLLTGCGATLAQGPSHPVKAAAKVHTRKGSRHTARKEKAASLSATSTPVLPAPTLETSSSPAPASLPAVPALSSLFGAGMQPQGDLMVPTTPTPVLAAWANSSTFGQSQMSFYTPVQGQWQLMTSQSSPDSISQARLGPTGPDGQHTLLLMGTSGGSSGAGIFYNIAVSASSVQFSGSVQGANPQFGSGTAEDFASDVYQPVWSGNQFTTQSLGIAATVPAGALQIPWSIQGSGIALSLPESPITLTQGATLAFVPSQSSASDSPTLLGPFTQAQAAQAALQFGNGAGGNLSMAQHVTGYVVTPPAGLSYWVLCEWISGSPAPSFGTVVTVSTAS